MKRVTGRGIIIKDNEMLLMERWRDGLHYFSIPGGGVEADETIEEAAVRELAEEMGVVVTLERKLYIVETNDSTHHIFLSNYVSGEAALHPESPEALEHAEGKNLFKPRWVSLEELPNLSWQYWIMLREQLLTDIRDGFTFETKTIIVS